MEFDESSQITLFLCLFSTELKVRHHIIAENNMDIDIGRIDILLIKFDSPFSNFLRFENLDQWVRRHFAGSINVT